MLNIIKLKFWILFNFILGQYLNVPILYSQFTPSTIKDIVVNQYFCPGLGFEPCKSNPNAFYIPIEINHINDFEDLIVNRDITYLFDITFSTIMTSHISAYAKQYNFMHLIYGFPPENPRQLTYFSDSQEIIIRDAAVSFVKYFGCQKVVVFLSQELFGMSFKDVSDVEIAYEAVIPSGISYEAISLIVSKEVKPLGVKIIIIATTENISKLLQKAIEEAAMNKEGYVFIFLHQSAWTAYLEGAILIEEYDWIPTGVENYIEILIEGATTFLLKFMNMSLIQGSFSLYSFYGILINQINTERFYLFNIQNNQRVLIGNITNNAVNLQSSPIFPGGTTNSPNKSKLQIPISIAGGASNPDGSTYNFNAICQNGSIYAMNYVNADSDILKNFELVINNIEDCGASYFESEYATDCYTKHSNDLGYFHIPPEPLYMANGILTVFESLNISVPVIGIKSSALMENNYYPQYTSVTFSNAYTARAVALLLSSFGIKKCSLLYLDTSWGQNFKNQFISQAKQYNLEVLNKIQAVPQGYDGTNKTIIQEIVDLKTRYVIMEVSDSENFSIIEAFYDLGMRRGDLYLVLGEGGFSASNSYISSDLYNKITEIGDRALYMSSLTYYGKFGKSIRKAFFEEYRFANDYMCQFYDATYLGAYAIDSMINRGFNVNSQGIEEWIRKIKFTGCSGNVQISKTGADRSTIQVGVYSLRLNSTSWSISLSGINDPTKSVYYESINKILWYADNDDILPSDIIGEDLSCPFKLEEVRQFFHGYLVLIIFGSSFLAFDIYLIYRFFKNSSNNQIPMLIEKVEANIFDYFIYLAMLIECLQYISIGPDLTDILPESLTKFSKISILDIREFIQVDHYKFFYQMIMIHIISTLWLIFLLRKIFDWLRNCKFILISMIIRVGNCFLLTVADIFFLPIIYFLFLDFQCIESIGDTFEKSFLNQDCTIFCWKGEHKNYAASSFVFLYLYLPASLYYRPHWKDLFEDINFHFNEQPTNLIVKSFLQIVLVILSTTLLPYSRIVFNICYAAIIAVFGIFTLLKMPFNYGRASLWYSIFIFGCVWLWICCEIAKFNIIFAQCALGIGWLLLGLIGNIYQKLKLPSFLEDPKGQDILKLFKFQLSRNSPSEAGIQNTVKYHYASQDNQDNNQINEIFSLEISD
ncbi:unnamed protein product [Blepharisma stoltei]|uniref:Receptor ligand binding region domain-containing protein n=1 Tax=Blepharisma stoltei TaxID=1481888 RepID=A0AAU9JCG0_9CILI|nr:unnamed protein product [Blepharisma stoltei]